MIRKLIRWLARHEIAEAYELGSKIGRALGRHHALLEVDRAYALGELEGQKAAFDALDDELRGRPATLEDVERARKGWRH